MADTKYLKDNLKGFVPVEVAGGIMDARGLMASICLGAQSVPDDP